MSFSATEFCNFAIWMRSKLPSNDPSQTVVRTIVSRAYYAALLTSSEETGIETKQDHQGVINAVKKRRYDLGNTLHSLKLLRQKADYQRDVVVSLEDADVAIKAAKRILTYFSRSLCTPSPEYLILLEEAD